ncbi:hypothetical protein [Streptomyces sp. NPDC008139]|uniref:hypothetical protein n=1 Tax=Streptomyces sp. NPDC008139 TaxID=3364814 RepID=UPI0036DFBAF2
MRSSASLRATVAAVEPVAAARLPVRRARRVRDRAAVRARRRGPGHRAVHPAFTTALSGVGRQETGSAAGLLSAVQQLGGTIGVAVIGGVYLAGTAHRAPPCGPPSARPPRSWRRPRSPPR